KIKSEKFPPDLSIDSIRYESHQPPLYYLVALPIYLAARALGFDVVLALRLFSVSLSLVITLLAFQIFSRVLTEPKWLPLVGAGIVATVPMHLATTSAISNDTLAEVIVAALLLISL